MLPAGSVAFQLELNPQELQYRPFNKSETFYVWHKSCTAPSPLPPPPFPLGTPRGGSGLATVYCMMLLRHFLEPLVWDCSKQYHFNCLS